MIVLVAAATGVGAVLRFLLDTAITARRRGRFPLGTFVINVLGAFVLGLVTALAAHGRLGDAPFDLLGPGLCAGFTTFSTWMWETLTAWRDSARIVAVSNIVLTVAVGGAAAALGLAAG
ncbi:fluoride efflux transporter FluC [Jatrophihabitans sp. YIM 134969]